MTVPVTPVNAGSAPQTSGDPLSALGPKDFITIIHNALAVSPTDPRYEQARAAALTAHARLTLLNDQANQQDARAALPGPVGSTAMGAADAMSMGLGPLIGGQQSQDYLKQAMTTHPLLTAAGEVAGSVPLMAGASPLVAGLSPMAGGAVLGGVTSAIHGGAAAGVPGAVLGGVTGTLLGGALGKLSFANDPNAVPTKLVPIARQLWMNAMQAFSGIGSANDAAAASEAAIRSALSTTDATPEQIEATIQRTIGRFGPGLDQADAGPPSLAPKGSSLPPLAGTESPKQVDLSDYMTSASQAVKGRVLTDEERVMLAQQWLKEHPVDVLNPVSGPLTAKPGHPVWLGEGSPTTSATVRGGEPLTPSVAGQVVTNVSPTGPGGNLLTQAEQIVKDKGVMAARQMALQTGPEGAGAKVAPALRRAIAQVLANQQAALAR